MGALQFVADLCPVFADHKPRPFPLIITALGKQHPRAHCLHAHCRLHPGPGGARVMAELVIHPLAVAVEEVAAGVRVEERQELRLQGLPPPMIPHSPSIASSTCYMLVRFSACKNDTGWHAPCGSVWLFG